MNCTTERVAPEGNPRQLANTKPKVEKVTEKITE